MSNNQLHTAKSAKKDEFYTQYSDIEKEIESHLIYDGDIFRNKVVYCNSNDSIESNFFRYFVLNFNRLGLKSLITTSYNPSPIVNTEFTLFFDDETPVQVKEHPKVTASKFIINEVGDVGGDKEFVPKEVAAQLKENQNNEWAPLEENGDFRSEECIDLLKQSDIVITNPPFSLFREFLAQIFEYQKHFLIIGNMNSITYRDVFPLIKSNRMWYGQSISSGDREFQVPDDYPLKAAGYREEDGKKYIRVKGVRWFTNLDHGRRHQILDLMSMNDNLKFNSKLKDHRTVYKKYDNYDAIEIPFTNAIPSDYDGVMGVPITFLDKYNPEQFEILGLGISNSGLEIGVKPYKAEHRKYRKEVQKRGAVDGDLYMMENGIVKVPYARILIKNKRI